jgi:pantetheine-phosphate adenylyltransferase
MRTTVYPGSFDPVTFGHIDVIERAIKLFDKVYVAVIRNPEKKAHFNANERLRLLKKSLNHLKNIEIDSFDGLLVNYVQKINASSIIRGLRAVSDFDYEFQMALTNRKMCPEIETVFLMTSEKFSYLSSSFIKQIADLGGDVSDFVPEVVAKALCQEQ